MPLITKWADSQARGGDDWPTEADQKLIDACKVHIGPPRVPDDVLNLGYREIALCVRHLAWLQADNPIAFALLGTAQVLLEELASLRRNVVIN